MPCRCGAAWASSAPTGSRSRPSELAALDPEAVAVVLDQVRPAAAQRRRAARPACSPWWRPGPCRSGRSGSTRWRPTAGPTLLDGCWVATERRAGGRCRLGTDDEAAAACVAGHLAAGRPGDGRASWWPTPPCRPGAPLGAPLSPARARTALARLEAKGSAIELPDGRWCARNLLVRLHGASRSRRRGMVDAVPIAEYVRFLTHWQHATPDSRLEGRAGLLEVLEQLQGIEAPAAEWEAQILPARVDRATTPAGSTSSASRARSSGAASPRGPRRTGRSGHAVAGHAAGLRACARTSRTCCAPCGPGRWRPSPRSARRPTCWRPCGPAAPASGPSWRPLTGPAPGRGGRGPVGPGGPGPRHGRRLLGRAVPALGP